MKLLVLVALVAGSLTAVTAQCETIPIGPNCLTGCSIVEAAANKEVLLELLIHAVPDQSLIPFRGGAFIFSIAIDIIAFVGYQTI
ncbi:hypothetical protein SISNIDRAFT_484285 [Sistotremastrum niveocremeum HHB9708]|uniref:Hydrophobin n=1 Tax=Sistotremastrum niveocremeum HHB9708 TaxID=1314777 RepID=A0A164W5A4_9AGAM|nr:hypothetical protein SISNIDRAFT_484285 [Sistotremastrum niveocremeum HHB9708]